MRNGTGNRGFSRRKTFITSERPPSEKEYPIIRSRLIEASQSKDYEEARREWDIVGVIMSDDVDSNFIERCELCNHGPLVANFVIQNMKNKNRFSVGSTCIKRFLILQGASNQAESIEIFEYRASKIIAAKNLPDLFREILAPEPSFSVIDRFRKASAKYLGTDKFQQVPRDTWDAYINYLMGENKNPEDIRRVNLALNDPGKLIKRKKTRLTAPSEEIGHWGPKKRSRVTTTLRSSKDDRPGR